MAMTVRKQRFLRLLAAVLLLCLLGGLGFFLFVRHRAGFAEFATLSPPPAGSTVPEWWVRPPPLIAAEVEFQRWLSAITWQLPEDRRDEH